MTIMKQRAVRLAEQIHHKAKVRAAEESITIRELIEKAVKEYLKSASRSEIETHS